MEKVRGFEIAKGFEGKGINLPERKTKNSAAYDIEAAEDVVIPSFKKGMKPTLVATGLKAYMQEDEVLYLYAKSSGFPKKGIMLSNNVGIIDGDYVPVEIQQMILQSEYENPYTESDYYVKLKGSQENYQALEKAYQKRVQELNAKTEQDTEMELS